MSGASEAGQDPAGFAARFAFGAGLLHVRSDLPEAIDGSLTPWSDRYHGLVLRVPGVRRVRRLELAGAFAGADPDIVAEPGALPDPARFLTLYDLKHPGIPDTAAFRAMAATGTDPNLGDGHAAGRLIARECHRRPDVAAARLFPAGEKLLHLAVQGDGPAVRRWLDDEAAPALLRAAGVVGVRWFDAGEGRHLILCELQGPIWPLPPSVGPGLGPAVWSAYRQQYVRQAPGE